MEHRVNGALETMSNGISLRLSLIPFWTLPDNYLWPYIMLWWISPEPPVSSCIWMSHTIWIQSLEIRQCRLSSVETRHRRVLSRVTRDYWRTSHMKSIATCHLKVNSIATSFNRHRVANSLRINWICRGLVEAVHWTVSNYQTPKPLGNFKRNSLRSPKFKWAKKHQRVPHFPAFRLDKSWSVSGHIRWTSASQRKVGKEKSQSVWSTNWFDVTNSVGTKSGQKC